MRAFLNGLWLRVQKQPVGTAYLVRSGLMVGAGLGLKLTVVQIGLIYLWVEGICMWATYNAVTPTITADEKVRTALYTPVPPPAPAAAGNP